MSKHSLPPFVVVVVVVAAVAGGQLGYGGGAQRPGGVLPRDGKARRRPPHVRGGEDDTPAAARRRRAGGPRHVAPRRALPRLRRPPTPSCRGRLLDKIHLRRHPVQWRPGTLRAGQEGGGGPVLWRRPRPRGGHRRGRNPGPPRPHLRVLHPLRGRAGHRRGSRGRPASSPRVRLPPPQRGAVRDGIGTDVGRPALPRRRPRHSEVVRGRRGRIRGRRHAVPIGGTPSTRRRRQGSVGVLHRIPRDREGGLDRRHRPGGQHHPRRIHPVPDGADTVRKVRAGPEPRIVPIGVCRGVSRGFRSPCVGGREVRLLGR
mmetsp:Transcript_35927/g.107353  ORF Transcript_35927/g.107353 Transcript_35927/m.107353 type:complete len:315 (+) Transcript_35927:1051-1995(+)